MKNNEIYNLWNNFINDNKYKKYFEDKIITFIHKLDIIKEYIDKNNIKPSKNNKDIDIKKLAQYTNLQHHYYLQKKFTMKNITIYNLWSKFINDDKYKNYFM